MGAWICVEREVGGIVAVTSVAVEVWMSSWNDRGHVRSERGSCSLCTITSVPLAGVGAVVGGPWLPVLPEGSTCPSGEAEVRQEDRALPCLCCRGRARRKSFPTGRRGRAL
jgi:hypothetical protein